MTHLNVLGRRSLKDYRNFKFVPKRSDKLCKYDHLKNRLISGYLQFVSIVLASVMCHRTIDFSTVLKL